MADIKWIKLSTDLFVNRKIKQIERRKDRSDIEIIWIKLLILAANINDSGKIYITRSLPYDTESLAAELDRPEASIATALDIFEQYGMIYREDGFIELTSWDKYQTFESDEERREKERVRKQAQRDKRKMSQDMSQGQNGTCPRDNLGHVPGTSHHRKEENTKEKEPNRKEERKNTDVTLSPYLSTTHNSFPFDVDEPPIEDDKVRPIGGTLGRGVVMLSNSQEADLLERLTVEEYDHYVNVIATQIERGKTYGKTHYQAILDMAIQDRAIGGR